MKRLIVLAVLLCTSAPAWAKELLSPPRDRITDGVIRGDLTTLTSLQQRLADLNDAGTGLGVYHFAKAQAWLDMAMDNYAMNDRTTVVEDAARQALRLIELLERKSPDLPMDTPLLPTSRLVRKDLWELAETYKKHPDFHCAEDTVAQLEVQLVWTGHEDNQLGWRHAKPYLQAAERLAKQAKMEMESCAPATRTAQAAAPAEPAAAPADVATPLPHQPPVLADICPDFCREQASKTAAAALSQPEASAAAITSPHAAQGAVPNDAATGEPVPGRIHFGLNRYALDRRSIVLLDRVASVLRREKDVTVTINGHADERGHRAYNLTLSKQRAETVRSYLVAAGVERSRLTVRAYNSSMPVAKGKDPVSFAKNRRVDLEFTGIDTSRLLILEEDLQLEKR